MSVVKRHPLVAFFVLAYALAWGGIPWNSFFAPGVLIAALIVVWFTEGVSGLRSLGARVVHWRVGPVWYVVALAVPLLVHLATIRINMALGAPSPGTDQFVPWHGLALVIGLRMIDPFNGPLSEEPSVRGYAQVQLQKQRTRLGATAVLAVLMAGWHAPLFFMPSFGLKPFEALTTVAVTFWYAWLFNRADGSVLVTLLAHAAEGGIHGRELWPSATDTTRQAWIYLAVWGAVAVGLLIADRRFWTEPAVAPAPVPDAAARPAPDAVGRREALP